LVYVTRFGCADQRSDISGRKHRR